ncbi:glycosyltransferase family 87 protein [Pyxidicoccus sp. MSG2]|uniref:glycosyltransferase family 87 protein n=1 Tax=Pyxidicoccus sp. MSG2 TaxID=2996790 RepID=UPI00226F7BFC|nr:glycosyltransferase family 87 protein [Pyxidicoccus sp. MSG2]MCY1022603.1 glycosyltransferase family 87 protein [Pyxidicoccus sp. MSG2]
MSAQSAAFRSSLNAGSALMAAFFAGLLAPLLVVLLVLVGVPFGASVPVGIIAGALLFFFLVPRVPANQVEYLRGKSRTPFVLLALAALLVVVAVGRLGVFMFDPNLKQFSLTPKIDFMVKHTCLSGYVSAAVLAEQGKENIFNLSNYKSHELDAVLPAVEPLERDYYAYPPQFLLLPKAMLSMSRDFFTLRAGWYVLYVAAALLSMWVVASWVGGREGAVLGVLTPVVWLSLPTLVNVQLGNIHLLVFGLCLGGMISFDKKRHALGGAMLAFAILAKIFPGVLGIYLLVQRRWKAAFWTAGFGALYTVVAFWVLGEKPFVDYITSAVPRISSGELFDFVWNFTPAILVNYSPFGVPFKLQLVGVQFADPLAVSRAIIAVYSLLVLVLAVAVSHRLYKREASGEEGSRFRLTQLVVWLALMSLSSFRSPFAPWTYCAVGGVWLFAAYAPFLRSGAKHLVPFILGWFVISIYGPPIVGPMVAFTLAAQTVLYVTGFWIALKVSAPATAPASVPVASVQQG